MAFRNLPSVTPLVIDDASGDIHLLHPNGTTTPLSDGAGGTPSDTVTPETSFGVAANAGGAGTFSRGDHTHGTPTDPIPAHVAAGDPHAQYALDSDLSAHVAAADPHPTYALDADLAAHVAAADPHTGYQLESASTADHITDATTTGKAVIRAADAAALTALINLATSALKGLVPASGGGTTNFLRADMTFAAPPGGGGGSATWTELEVDFGATPVYDARFTITDAGIAGSGSKVAVLPCGKAATGRTADDWQWDGAVFAVQPAAGSATCFATFHPGPIVGRRMIQYQIGS